MIPSRAKRGTRLERGRLDFARIMHQKWGKCKVFVVKFDYVFVTLNRAWRQQLGSEN